MTEKQYDVVILGTGPAGLQAAIHAARRKVSVLVLGRHHKSSAFRAHIENYCCISGMTGQKMIEEGRLQAEKAGATLLDEDVISIEAEDEGFALKLESGTTLLSAALILAMGISRNRLNVPGEKELLGHGLSYCVDCDAGFYRGEAVVIIGGESAAVSGALTLLFYAKEVHLVCERLDVAGPLAQKVKESAIIVHEQRKVKAIEGQDSVQSLLLDDGTRIRAAGLFIELGAKGAVELAGNLGVQLDPQSMQYIVTNKKQETNVTGIYAAGDICGPPWQVAKAVGEGCIAGLEAAAYAKRIRQK
jgi:thioredoxin reductase (NADPH)